MEKQVWCPGALYLFFGMAKEKPVTNRQEDAENRKVLPGNRDETAGNRGKTGREPDRRRKKPKGTGEGHLKPGRARRVVPGN